MVRPAVLEKNLAKCLRYFDVADKMLCRYRSALTTSAELTLDCLTRHFPKIMDSTTRNIRRDQPLQKQQKYLRVKSHLMNKLQSGAYRPGMMLPKERELAVSLGVAPGTLRQALREIEADGLIRRVRGQGTFATTPDQRQSLVRSKLFSLIVPQVREGLYPSLIHGIEQAIAGTPYRLTVGNSCNELSRQEELIRQAIDDNSAGVILVPTLFPPAPMEHVRPILERRIPLVFCHRSVDGVEAPVITWSGQGVGQMVAKHLLEQGHRRIATIVAMRDPLVNATVAAIQQEVLHAGLPPSSYSVRFHGERLPGSHARAAIAHVLEELLADVDRPTAIHCANLPDAEQVYMLAGEMGLSIPKDLSLIYFGDNRRLGGLAQRLTCVAVAAEQIGQRAGKLLEEMIAGSVSLMTNERIEIPLTFLSGETVCLPPEEATHG